MKYKFLIYLPVFICLLVSRVASLYGALPKPIEDFDLRFYDPIKYGLQDLTFEARISDLNKILSERKSFGKVEDVYFKIYWIFPGEYHIEVEGISAQFKQLKQELKSLIIPRLDYVVPRSLGSKFDGFNFQKVESKAGILLRGSDETGRSEVSKIDLNFLGNGILKQIKIISANGTQVQDLEMSAKSWSKGKWVLSEVVSEQLWGTQKTTIKNSLKYEVFAGLGFPVEIESETTVKPFNDNDKNAEIKEVTYKNTIQFSKYMVNQGAAKKFLDSGVRI